jgi:ABC-type microcin C transport system duplicated ATPase subunit YejF
MTSLRSLYTVGNQIIEVIRLHNRVSKYETRQRAIDLLAKVGTPKPEVRTRSGSAVGCASAA